jgi:uncharacterized protein
MNNLKSLIPQFKVIRGFNDQLKKDSTGVLSELCNWTHPSLIAKNINKKGQGIFTTTQLKKGELLIMFGGRVLTTAQTELIPPDLDMSFQIEDDLFFVPVDLKSLGVAERLNHSCGPNAGFSGQMSVAAIRDILPGEEVCIDYATCEARPSFEFECKCGSALCRDLITGNDWLRPEVQERLGEYFQPFLKRRIFSINKLANKAGNL